MVAARQNSSNGAWRILVVDDSPEDRVLYNRMFRKSGLMLDVVETECVAEGLALSRQYPFDCVLVDYNLPDASGVDFIEAFKRESIDPETAIVMITGQGSEETAVTAMKMGALDYVSKDSVPDGFFVQTLLNAIERSQLKRQVAQYQKDLEDSNRALSEFTHTVSHDLKAPLRRISSFCQFLKDEAGNDLSPDARDYVERICHNADRLQRFISDLLIYAQAMDASEKKEKVDLGELIKEVVEDLEPLMEENRVTIIYDKMPILMVYPLRIRQLFMNLLTNAIKYHGKAAPVIRIGCVEYPDHHVIRVEDNGLGIPPEHHQRVFEAFHRLHTQEEIEGTGLGLSICKQVVDMHKGHIAVESKPGQGATFLVSLPKA